MKPKVGRIGLSVKYIITENCNAHNVGYGDGSKSRCIRLKVENNSTTRIRNCEGFFTINELPRLSAAKLFWVDMGVQPSMDMIKGIPRYLQILRIHQDGIIIPATWGIPPEQWPIDLQNRFLPGNNYTFHVSVKGHDEAETIFYDIKLEWNGDWQTAVVIAQSPSQIL